MNPFNKIAQLFKPKQEPVQTELAGIVAQQRVLDDHPSHKITPAKLKNLLEEAENGDLMAQHQLFMDIEEQDSSIAANIQTRKRAALTLDWAIKPPRNATPAEEKLTQEVEELFFQLGYLDDLVIDCMDAVGHGFSALEIIWEYRKDKWFPARFVHRPPSWFLLDKDDKLLLKTPDNQLGEPLLPFKWVVHTHKNRSTQFARNGLYRTLAWLYMFKHYSLFDFAEFLELYGFPIRIGKYGAGTTAEEKRSLKQALLDIGHNAAGIMPESMQIELHNAAQGTSQGNNPYLQMIDWCEKSIARMILGQTLTSGADGKSSTNALGVVHNEVRRDLLISDAKQLAQTFSQQIILPYLQLNFANVDPTRLPYFEFDTKEPADIKTMSEALPALVGIGLPISVQWALEKLGIPEVEEGEAVLNPLEKAVKAPLKTDQAEADKPTQTDKTALSAKLHSASCQCGCQAVRLSGSFANQLSDEQATLDAIADFAEAEPDFNRQLEPVLKQTVALLQACGDYEQAYEALSALYPELSDKVHQRYLEQALFLSELLGGSSAESQT